jgi:large subunit ribosomal protein L14e
MLEVGRVCMKLAGRDSNNYCVVVQKIDEDYVLIEGNVRRRKCNIKHLHPQKQVLAIKEGADHKAVMEAFKKESLPVKEKGGFKVPKGVKTASKAAEAKPKAAKPAEAKPAAEKPEAKAEAKPKEAKPKKVAAKKEKKE